MSNAPRPTSILPPSTSSLRQSSIPNTLSSASSSSSSAALQSRIASKRQELEQLRQLRDLSGALATQMSALEAKLATLRDGAESVACVLANWDNVLQAIRMASSKLPPPPSQTTPGDSSEPELPTTLVRIPVHNLQQNGEAQNANGATGG